MFLASGAVWLPLIGAALHPLLGACIQASSRRGVSLTVTVSLANLITSLIFFCYLDPQGGWSLDRKDFWALGNGVVFFLGQWFSIQSVKSGDLAVHSSALGMKVVLVGALSMWVGLEASSWNLLLGMGLAALAVFLVSGGSWQGWRTHQKTVWLTLVACVFFGLNDFLTGWRSRELGADRWLVLMMGTSGLISSGLLLSRRRQLGELLRTGVTGQAGAALRFTIGAGGLLGIQALAVNLAFSQYGQPTLSNIVYSSRGVMAVLFVFFLQRAHQGRLLKEQVFGSILMMVALVVVLRG